MQNQTAKDLQDIARDLDPSGRVLVERLSLAMEHLADEQKKQGETLEKITVTLTAIDRRLLVHESHDLKKHVDDHEARLRALEITDTVRRDRNALAASMMRSPVLPWLVAAIAVVGAFLTKAGLLHFNG